MSGEAPELSQSWSELTQCNSSLEHSWASRELVALDDAVAVFKLQLVREFADDEQ